MLRRLNSALSPERIELIDDSEQHRGHGGYNPGRRKPFQLGIESAAFAGKNRVRATADDLCRARRPDGRAGPRFVDPRHRAGRTLMATIETAFEQIITPVTHDLGDFKVNRSLPARERTMVGPFIFVDEFGPARLPAGAGMDVRPHPHINLATVTYLFDGAIEHRDSIGSHAGDRARRDQPDDGGQRHRPFGALAGRRCGRTARASTACRPGSRCPTAERKSRRGSTMCRRRAAAGRGRWRERARAHGQLVGRDCGDAVPLADDLCRHPARRRRRLFRSRPTPTNGR